jgi:EAL domain-containing protein (putative c-di-GMP-specific phosphodiesterase class I)/AmiR/NasT family two-component response regulator
MNQEYSFNLSESAILIVDDLPPQARLLVRVLEQAGYQKLTVEHDPFAALERFKQEEFDLILLDYEMPEMDGLQLMEAMLAHQQQIHEGLGRAVDYLPIIMVTADNQESIRIHALSNGAKDFISKPFNRKEVVSRVNNLLEIRQMHQQLLAQNRELNEQIGHRFSNEELERIEEIREGVKEQQFGLFYQPQIRVSEGQPPVLEGLEGLARWHHPERGVLPPLDFIDLAERSGLIFELGEQLLRQACQQFMRWSEAGSAPEHISVNLSARQFADTGLEQRVVRVLEESGMPPERLCLEVTESIVMEDIEEAIKTLGRLRERGLRISIDDFGTGYSSLSYLKYFPVDMLKIDRSFIQELPGDSTSVAIVRAIHQLTRDLGIATVVEGCESEAQVEFLCIEGLQLIQGFYYGRPQPADAVARRWLQP